MTTVPEGHRVVVVHLARQPTFGRSESGVYVCDTGLHAASEQLIARVAQLLVATPQARVILVVQPSALARELSNPPGRLAPAALQRMYPRRQPAHLLSAIERNRL